VKGQFEKGSRRYTNGQIALANSLKIEKGGDCRIADTQSMVLRNGNIGNRKAAQVKSAVFRSNDNKSPAE